MVSAWAPDALEVRESHRTEAPRAVEPAGDRGPTGAGTGGNVAIDLSAVAPASIIESWYHEGSLRQFCVYPLNTVEHR